MDNISIITPAYKAVNFIDDYIKSFENQKNIYNISYELIIGVDGCIETKEKLLSKKLPDYVKIFWFEYNYGPYIVKNSIVNESKWPYIIFFDIDDIALPNFIDINIEERSNYDILRQSIQYSNKPAYGIIGLWKQTWEKIGGYQPWKCQADSELLERSKLMEFTQGRTNEKTFYRREHENQLTKAKETFKGSSLREDYKKLVGKYKGKIDPITAYYKRILLEETMNKKEGIISDLVACKKAFDKINIPWVIIGGIVLGYARYKDIMEWDTDLDVGIFVELSNMQWKSVHKALCDQGFRIKPERDDFIYGKRKVKFNLEMFHKKGEFYEMFPKSTPDLKIVEQSKWFDEIQLVDFLGDKYPMPNNIEDFVIAHYGMDWKTNIIKDHEKYFTDKRGGRDQSKWLSSRAGKNGDLWPKILKIDDNMGAE